MYKFHTYMLRNFMYKFESGTCEYIRKFVWVCANSVPLQVKLWTSFMKATDVDNDGKLSYPEFKQTIIMAQAKKKEIKK